MTLKVLLAAFAATRGNSMPGTDGVTPAAFSRNLDQNLEALRRSVVDRCYRPGRLLRLSRAKPSGGIRIIGVPTVGDRVLQRAVLAVATPRIDPQFRANVHGFRPGRSPTTATRHLVRQVGGRRHLALIKVDVEGMFDNLPHHRLERAAHAAWGDPLWSWLVRAWCRAWGRGGRGVPQGASLSPLLANIFMHAHVDRYLNQPGPGAPGLAGWIRYADDIIMVVDGTNQPWRVLSWLDGLHRHAGLRLAPGKTWVAANERCPVTFPVLGRPVRFRREGQRWHIEVL